MIKFLVKGQNIETLEHEVIAADQIAFVKIHFVFDNSWKPLHKVVQFTQDEFTYNRVLGFDETSCHLPAELAAGAVKMSLFGYDAESSETVRATTVVKTLHIRPSGFDGESSNVPPTPDLYQQLLQKISEKGADGKSAFEIAVENGFIGTEAEWLESLKGKDGKDGVDGKNGQDGKDGIDGKSAYEIAKLAGVNVPEDTKILIGEVESVDIAEEFAHEKLSPVLAMYKAKTFDEALDKAAQLVADGGYGHTSSLYVHPAEKEKIQKHYEAMKTCRVLINTPASQGGIGDLYNFKLAPSLTLGCGSWGGNSVSENVGVKHLLNVKTVAERRENMLWFRTPEKVYFKKGCMPVALDELGTVMHKKKAFIVTDTFLYKNGYVDPIEKKLDEMGIQHTCFYNVAPDPTLQCAQEGVAQMRAFEPDTIIALGGGSAMDAAKIMWLMYEHPEANFEDMAMDFMDIRKRVFTFPKMGEKAYFVAIPTSSGTGSEVTPFAIITDAETGVKWPIADYELLPNMAIVDVDNAMTAPKGLTSASGIDVMTHAIEAYVSIMATDYTDGLAMKAVKMVFENLPSAYENGANDPKAREEMANASCMAGMAFANAFLGVNHSMAHKLGAFHHLPHGVANAVILTEVMRYNAAEVPTKMGTFSQYQYPHALARYAELGRFAGCTGNTDEEVFENFIAKLEDLKEKIGIKKTIKDYGIDEKYFLDTLDDMCEQAFNDQCTGANPRYPLMKEMKEIYLKCYYGK